MEAIQVLEFLEEFEEVEEALEVDKKANSIALIAQHTLHDRENPLEYYCDKDFQENFAFSKQGFLFLLETFGEALTTANRDRDRDIPVIYKLSTFLHYLRSNGFLRNVASQSYVQMSEASVCRIVNSVAITIANFSSKYITFPDAAEQKEIATRYVTMINL